MLNIFDVKSLLHL